MKKSMVMRYFKTSCTPPPHPTPFKMFYCIKSKRIRQCMIPLDAKSNGNKKSAPKRNQAKHKSNDEGSLEVILYWYLLLIICTYSLIERDQNILLKVSSIYGWSIATQFWRNFCSGQFYYQHDIFFLAKVKDILM